MADKWQLIHPNHVNAIVDGYEATIEHFRDRVGFTLDRRIPDSGDGTDACLMTLGGVMFEFFAPKERGERGQGRLLSKFGEHYIGIEYHVPDVTSAREFAVEKEIRIINDLGAAFFTYPGNSFGIAFEIYDGDFAEHAQPTGYWENQQPLGLTGMARLTVAVESVEAAVARLNELAYVSDIGPVCRPRRRQGRAAAGRDGGLGNARTDWGRSAGGLPGPVRPAHPQHRVQGQEPGRGREAPDRPGLRPHPRRRGRRAGHHAGAEQEPPVRVHRVTQRGP